MNGMIGDVRRMVSRLNEISNALKLAAEEALSAGAEAALAEAKSRAPVRTGSLRASLSAQSNGLTARVATDCAYAAAVEFGSGRRAPQPFLSAAALRMRSELPAAARSTALERLSQRV